MIVTLFVLPLYSANGYSILEHTTSQLAAQNTPNSWVMQFVFVFLAITTLYRGFRTFRKDTLLLLLVLCFGSALLLAAVFSHAPITPSLPYDVTEDWLHSVFSSLTGFSFTLLAISVAFSQKERTRVAAVVVVITTTVLTFALFQLPELAGIWQRLIFIISFGWLFHILSNETAPKKPTSQTPHLPVKFSAAVERENCGNT